MEWQEGVVAGGVFSGTSGVKTVEERAMFGGFANAPYDACYQLECDSTRNINLAALADNSFAAAYALQSFGQMADLHSELYQ